MGERLTTVADVLAIMDEIAPPELAEDYDNVGLLAGCPDARVTRVLVALDLTRATVEKAASMGAQLIVTHHPVMFLGRKNMREDDPEGAALCELIRRRIALIAAHTNYDIVEGGLNAALAEALDIRAPRQLSQGAYMGEVAPAIPLSALAARAETALGGPVRVFGDADKEIKCLAVLGGAGGDFAHIALEAGADAFLTGEIKYHAAIEMRERGLAILEAGHYETEHIALKSLAACLQTRANALQYTLSVAI